MCMSKLEQQPKRKRIEFRSSDFEPSPSTTHLHKKTKDHMNITPAMSLHGSMQNPNQVPQGSFTPMSPYHPHLAHMVHPGTFMSSPPNTNGTGVGVPQQHLQQSVLTDIDVQRIAVTVKGLLVTELNNALEPLKKSNYFIAKRK